MTDSVPQNASAESGPIESADKKNAYCGLLQSSMAHQILTLIGFAFICFEVVFIELYFDNFWFGLDLSMLGIPAILAAVAVAQLLLSVAETEYACRLLSFALKGKPLLVYRNWLKLTEQDIVFGSKHIRYEAIDELELSWFGNLIIKSRIVCGADAKSPDILLKFPFAAASFDTQEIFLAAVRSKRPGVKMNKKLETGRNPTMQKGSQATQLMTASLMTLLLLDVGFSSFYFLEMLKNLYLAETDLLHSSLKESEAHFGRAENLRLHPLPISWVTGKFLKDSTVAAGIWEQRSRVLALQGKTDEAIEDSLKAIKEAPKNLRHRLYLSRLFVDSNKIKEANEQLDKIIEDHK
ncbi:MAG: tetratricopeptide repeat protein, partial [Candidatus Obscuribacterales bacterium]|nr:tetratricopeptide repeat protein [Candidatus Obscuribacterales bacterium]